jgi:hypothetical protein
MVEASATTEEGESTMTQQPETNYCSSPGCNRAAKPGDSLCSRHRAARNVGSGRRLKHWKLVDPTTSKAMRDAFQEQVRRTLQEAEQRFTDPGERWDYVRAKLLEERAS